MRQVGVLEAKTNLSALLDSIEQTGEEIVITRHGRPVARISPFRVEERALSRLAFRAQAVQERQQLRGLAEPEGSWNATDVSHLTSASNPAPHDELAERFRAIQARSAALFGEAPFDWKASVEDGRE